VGAEDFTVKVIEIDSPLALKTDPLKESVTARFAILKFILLLLFVTSPVVGFV
jgi:hypothetical protein